MRLKILAELLFPEMRQFGLRSHWIRVQCTIFALLLQKLACYFGHFGHLIHFSLKSLWSFSMGLEERVKSPESLFQKASRLFHADRVQICAVEAVGLRNP